MAVEGTARPGRDCATPSRSSLPPPSRLPPVGAEATGPRDNGLPPPPPPVQPPPVGSRRRKAGLFGLGEGSALSLPGPALQGRTPSSPLGTPLLLAKHLETPGRKLLGSGSPYLTGTQESRQGGQEQQLGRRRRRRHPGPPQAGLPPVQPTRDRLPPGPAPAHPRRPRAHVDPGLARAGLARPQTARLDSPSSRAPRPRSAPGLAPPPASPRPAPTAPGGSRRVPAPPLGPPTARAARARVRQPKPEKSSGSRSSAHCAARQAGPPPSPRNWSQRVSAACRAQLQLLGGIVEREGGREMGLL